MNSGQEQETTMASMMQHAFRGARSRSPARHNTVPARARSPAHQIHRENANPVRRDIARGRLDPGFRAQGTHGQRGPNFDRNHARREQRRNSAAARRNAQGPGLPGEGADLADRGHLDQGARAIRQAVEVETRGLLMPDNREAPARRPDRIRDGLEFDVINMPGAEAPFWVLHSHQLDYTQIRPFEEIEVFEYLHELPDDDEPMLPVLNTPREQAISLAARAAETQAAQGAEAMAEIAREEVVQATDEVAASEPTLYQSPREVRRMDRIAVATRDKLTLNSSTDQEPPKPTS
ncbi:hypothetical protein MMC17_007065 [Xylographa soralifera]|nr:hypothetical protein [Xylographa soralifera]